MLVSDFNFHLPEELIAQEPLAARDGSRMLHLQRTSGQYTDRLFRDFPDLLRPGDLVVFNNTRVFPARLYGRREGSRSQAVSPHNPAARNFLQGRIEVLLTRQLSPTLTIGNAWFAPDARSASANAFFSESTTNCRPKFSPAPSSANAASAFNLLPENMTKMTVTKTTGKTTSSPLSAASATSHFRLTSRAPILLAISIATKPFMPNRTDRSQLPPPAFTSLQKSSTASASVAPKPPRSPSTLAWGLFSRFASIASKITNSTPSLTPSHSRAASAINQALRTSRRVIAIGTTTVRTLEHAIRQGGGSIVEGSGAADLFIYPGFEFKVVNAMLTNFHLPQSSLLMLVSAFAGRENVLRAYEHAVRERYRFYSYGDCMFIE